MKPVIIDIRETDEFEAEHVEDSIHLPLGQFQSRIKSLAANLGDKEILLLCRSGRRAKLALDQARASDMPRVSVLEGGIIEWKKQGRPTVVSKKNHFPIMRQVQIAAGALILVSVGLATWVDLRFIGIAGFVGAGLSLAGWTGFCGMAEILARMPWNRSSSC